MTLWHKQWLWLDVGSWQIPPKKGDLFRVERFGFRCHFRVFHYALIEKV